jgi:hypothetical protein
MTFPRSAFAAALFLTIPLCLAACGSNAGTGPDPVNGSPDTGKPAEEPPPAEDTGTPPVEDTAPPATDTKPVPQAPPICPAASGVYTATPTAHDVLFLLDRSGSMHAKVASGKTRWEAATAALSSLLDVIADGSSVRSGLDMFPRGDKPISCCWIDSKTNYTTCSCATGELPGTTARCAATSYSPALVPVATLADAQKALIRTGMHKSDAEFYWGTPMKAALQGAIAKAASLDLDGVRSVVLITDGEPTSCNATDDKIDAVVGVAAAGTALVKPVQTYVVGVIDGSLAANAANLSKVAVAGGTPRAAGCETTNSCFYAVDVKTFESDIAKAFTDIEMKAFSCTFDVPVLASGDPDFDMVNVTMTKPGGAPATLSKDTTHKDGWDFIESNKKIQLYGDACTSVKADVKTAIQIVVGCKTIKK